MKHIRKKILVIMLLFITPLSILSAASVFSGFAGGKIKFYGDETSSAANEDQSKKFNPGLSLQAFFASQIGFTQNAWSHIEFSIDTKNLLAASIFEKTDARFKIDELSLILRQPLDIIDNYFSVFMGTYDPIGSDIFLQRQFSLNPIASKLTESWLGMSGSLIYPHFGIGLSDVIHFSTPMVAGLYLYVNRDDAGYYVFNADLRYACSFRFFTADIAAGLGAPMADKYQAEDVIVVVESLNWHVGTTMLVGNNYTHGLFLQAGIYNASFRPKQGSTLPINVKDIYLLFEPRFRSKTMQIHFTAYSLPEKTVEDLLFIHDTLGVDLNIFTDSFKTRNKGLSFGIHATLSFPQKTFYDFTNPLSLFTDGFNVFLTPYLTTKIFGGDLNAMVELNLLQFGKSGNCFAINVGYKTAF